MPLKLVTFSHTKNFFVRGTVGGKRVLESTGTTNRKLAEEYRRKREAEFWQEQLYGTRSVITFADAATAYIKEAPRSPATSRYVDRLVEYFGDTKLSAINNASLRAAYAGILRDGEAASPATKKRTVRTPLQAILEFGAIQGWCDRPAFAAISVPTSITRFLLPEQATDLVEHAAPHLQPLFVFLIGTGCRLSEALDLQWKDVDLYGCRAVVWQKQGRQRYVDLCPAVVKWLARIADTDGHVFRPAIKTRKGTILGDRYHDSGRQYGGQIKNGWAGACSRAGLPGRIREWVPAGAKKTRTVFVPEFTPHDLRHTWASWHYCVYRDLLRLKSDGDWSNINTVTIYAKLMPPVYREEIVRWWGTGPAIALEGENP
ncbi:tyrosine recombinase XerC [Acetobacter okinawensis]|uniref:Integrase n=1 Tax=Acetobacter okinawensis TaxID=1076594 RepID=A0A252BY26_9PROT|nr:site-specific integrase [Acetobacter okinawensis]OUJ13849.1 integrase [Acetobacter okinawensis]